MIKEHALIVNAPNCVGCNTCELACKQEHNLPVGVNFIKVRAEQPRIINGKPQLRYAVSHCVHCSKPSCLEACPVMAITKREDGIVLIDEDLCIGCRLCVDVCPIGVMDFAEDTSLAKKCDLCVSRLDRGLNPACVDACPAYCIHHGETGEVIRQIGPQELLTIYKRGR